MALAIFGAVRSSPGTTTAALAVAGCIPPSVVIEGDPDGTAIAPRYGLGREPNVASLATAARTTLDSDLLAQHCHQLPGGVPAVIGLASPDRSVSFWRNAGLGFAAALATVRDHELILDAGRLSPTSPLIPLVDHADITVLVARPTPEELLALSHRLPVIRERARACAVILIGERPYSRADVARQLDVEVLGVIAHDPAAAQSLAGTGDGRSLRRSALARSARATAQALVDRLDRPPVATVDAGAHEEVVSL